MIFDEFIEYLRICLETQLNFDTLFWSLTVMQENGVNTIRNYQEVLCMFPRLKKLLLCLLFTVHQVFCPWTVSVGHWKMSFCEKKKILPEIAFLCKRLVSFATSCSIWLVSHPASRLRAVNEPIRRETHRAFSVKWTNSWWPQADFRIWVRLEPSAINNNKKVFLLTQCFLETLGKMLWMMKKK